MAWAVEPLKNENMANWQIEPARVAEQTVLDDDTGQIYRAPVTFDEQDIRFAIATQVNKEPKRDFIGKVKYAAGEAWNWAEKFADRVEGGFQSAERGAVGLAGQALDTFLHASLSVPARVEQIEKYKNGDFSDWDASLNGRVTDEDIAKEADPALQAAMQFRKDRQDALMAKAEERLEQRQRIRRKLDASIRKWQEVLRPEAEMNNYDRFMEAMGSGTASLALSVATLAATKNPQVAAGIMAGTFGRMRYTDVFDKSVEKGLDYATADDYATIAGTIEGGIELALEPFLYGVANLRPVRKITDEMIGGAVARLNATAAGKSAARKIVSKHRQSVGKQSLKAAAIEGSEEALQEAGGAYFENYTGLENTPQEEIMARTLLSFAVGGLTGAGAAVMGTSAYNREAAATNERIKQSLTQAYPELTTEEKQKTADALQEIFYQDGEGRMLNELELLADKENDPDTLESGKHEISEDMRSILKKRYQMSDEEIDRTAEIAVSSIDLRNQFNEAQTAFYDELVEIGTNPNVAEPFSRLMAARASAVAMNEKKTVKDVLERWNLKFERKTRPIDYNALLDDEILFQSEAYDTQGKADINTPEFKAWFGDSKVVDENGKPLVVYHGTGADFGTFDVSKSGKNTGNKGFYGDGIYLTDKDSEAKFYAQQSVIDRFGSRIFGNMSYDKAQQFIKDKSIIMPLYVSLKNPFMWNSITTEEEAKAISRKIGMKLEWNEKYKQINHFRDDKKSVKFSEKLKQAGYDGVIYKGDNGREIVVFEPNQIKSVYNRGAFDQNNGNIYYQGQIDKTPIKISGNELGEIKDTNNLRRKAYKYFQENLQGNYASHPVLGKIKFIRKGIDKVKSTSADIDKLKLVPKIKDIIETAAYLRSETPKKPHGNIVKFHYLSNSVNLEGKNIDVFISIAEDNEGNFFYNINKDKNQPSQDDAVQMRSGEGLADKSAININIASKGKNVNNSLRQGAPENARGTWDAGNDNIYYQSGIMENQLQSREGGPEIAPDDIMIEPVEIKIEDVPDFKTTADLRKWLIGKFEEIGSITINATGATVDFNKSAAQRSIKNARKSVNNIAYPEIEKIVSGAQYSGFRKADERHQGKVKGQDVYHTGVMYKGVPYRVEFYVDVPLSSGGNNYAGQNIRKIRIEPQRHGFNPVSNEANASQGSIRNISLAVLRGKVNPARYDISDSSLRQGAPEDARGAYDAAKRLIMLFEGADPSTLVHEAAHFFLDDMRRFADNATTAEELQAIYRYVGSTDGVLTTEQNEYFARSFEAYLMEGKAPNSLLGRVFEKFRKWLRAIYSQIKNLNVKLDDNIRKTFDEMLGGRKLDFAMQMSRERLAEDIKAGNIGQVVINKALRLLEEGKMSKADMEEMIGRLEDGRLKRSDVKKYLEPFVQSTNRHHEAVYEWDYQRYRRRLERGNVTPAAVRKKIDRLLEWSKPRTQNGKVVGRFPDIKVNRFFDAVRENINLKRDEALAKIDANLQRLDEITQKGMSGEDGNFRNVSDIIWENKVLAIPAGRASVGLMVDVYNDIAEIYNTGRLSERVTGMVKRAWRERLIGEAVAVLDQGQGTNWRRESSDLAKRMRRFGLSMFSWNGILDVLSMFDKSSKSGESALSRNLTVFKEEKKMRYGVYEDGETVSRLMAGALGSVENGGISVNRYINKVLPEKFTIEWGSNAKRFSKDQLLDIYMKAKDPETREIMVNDDVLQFNEEFFSRVDEHLSEQDKAVAEALFQFYEETYDKLNRFYEEHYGISLGHREFYSPRSMDKGGIDVVSGDLRSYAGLSAIKKRTAKGGQIKIKGAFNVLQNYINNSNHFIAFADKLQDINAVLGDAEVKNRIRNVFGEKMNEKIAYEISRFASNDKVYVQGINGIMSKLRANYAVSVLGLKPSLAIKQLTGFPAYWENVPTKDFLEGLADFARHPKQAIETLGNSQYMKTRGTNIIKDFEEVSKSEMLKNLGTKIGLREFLMLNIQLGDRGSIYMGGWALYKYMLKKTGDPVQAMAEFERITNETQQSSYMSEQSAWQSNPFGNWFTMFQSSQNQYLRKELTALRGLATGRMDWDKAMKTLFIYHFLLPMFFQFVSDGFRWDKDAQLRAAVLGSLNGAFVLGKVMERMVDWAITGTLNYKLGIKELFPPVSVLENGAKFLSDSVNYAVDDISLEDYMEALRGAVRTAGEATGLPLKYPMDVAAASGDYLDEEEYGKAVLLWLGWSPYALRDLEE